MNWTAIGAIGEIAGALAVVVSLVYVSIQVRANSKALNVTIRNDVSLEVSRWNQLIMTDGTALTLLHRGCTEGTSVLTEAEQRQFTHMMFSILAIWENTFEHVRDGVLDAAKAARLGKMFSLFVHSPGGQEYWAMRKSAFHPDFQSMVDSINSPELGRLAVMGPDSSGASSGDYP
jgi:hypothetical protein